MKRLNLALVAAVSVWGLYGCATMFNSGQQTIVLSLDPVPGKPEVKTVPVTVETASGAYRSTAPSTIVATPSTFKEVSVRISDPCFEPQTINANKSVTLSYFVNILNFIGFFIDPLTGAMWKYDQSVVLHPQPVKDYEACRAKNP